MSIEIKCPLCDTEGWPTFALLDGYMAICGTAWSAVTEPRQSPACSVIAKLRWEVTFLRLTAGEVAA